MLFNSYAFIFGFLPVCLLGFFVLSKRGCSGAASIWLILVSLFFYGWWNPDPSAAWTPKYLGIILTSIVFNYVCGVWIDLARRSANSHAAKGTLTLGIVANLCALGYFKYAHFCAGTANALLGTNIDPGHISLPLAISFFTFTQIAYLVDAFRGMTTEYNFRGYLLFVSFFPHLIAGPIVRYRDLMPQFARKETWRLNAGNLAAGLSLFTFGLFKKVVFADTLAPTANMVFGMAKNGSVPGLLLGWTGVLAYTLQLYFDFSGYSDMAIGLARMFNVQFPLNFNSPYKARDIADFWRRWHITLSEFLRDHLYIPLGGNRRGERRRNFNLLVTMLLGGLWHGAGWTFVIWGGLHGVFLVVNRFWVRATAQLHWADSRPARLAGWLVTILSVMAAWVFFRAASCGEAFTLFRAMAGMNGIGHLSPGLAALPCLLAVIAFLAPNTQELFQLAEQSSRKKLSLPPVSPIWRITPRWAVCTAIVFAIAVIHLSDITEFLYFKF